jgi:hypothetical protein
MRALYQDEPYKTPFGWALSGPNLSLRSELGCLRVRSSLHATRAVSLHQPTKEHRNIDNPSNGHNGEHRQGTNESFQVESDQGNPGFLQGAAAGVAIGRLSIHHGAAFWTLLQHLNWPSVSALRVSESTEGVTGRWILERTGTVIPQHGGCWLAPLNSMFRAESDSLVSGYAEVSLPGRTPLLHPPGHAREVVESLKMRPARSRS